MIFKAIISVVFCDNAESEDEVVFILCSRLIKEWGPVCSWTTVRNKKAIYTDKMDQREVLFLNQTHNKMERTEFINDKNYS